MRALAYDSKVWIAYVIPAPQGERAAVTVHYCSLIVKEPQVIPAGDYHAVRFPFGDSESYDESGMHQAAQPDGHRVTNWRTDKRSALIWPTTAGLATLTAMARWEKGTYRQIGARFVRDPLNLATGWDATATDERTPTPDVQRCTYTWQILVRPGTPIAFEVHNGDSRSRKLLLAEFKLAIHPTAKGN